MFLAMVFFLCKLSRHKVILSKETRAAERLSMKLLLLPEGALKDGHARDGHARNMKSDSDVGENRPSVYLQAKSPPNVSEVLVTT